MSQAHQWVKALKQHLKSQGLTYKDVATALNLSEASIKRVFTTQSFTLERLEHVAEYAGLSLAELAELAQNGHQLQCSLSWEQEECIVQDLTLLIVAVSVLSGYTFSDLIEQYHLTPTQAIRALAQLDKIGLIELLPNNRIRLRIAPTFQWLAGGPIQQYFLKCVMQDFLTSKFDQTHEKLLVHNGLCSQSTNTKIQQRMSQLIQDAYTLMQEDKSLPMHKKFGNTLVLALRQWQFSEFQPVKPNDTSSNTPTE